MEKKFEKENLTMEKFQTEKEKRRAERTRQICERYNDLTRDYPEVFAIRRLAVVGREFGLSTQRVYQILMREGCYKRKEPAPKVEKHVGKKNDVDERFFAAFQSLLDDGTLRSVQQFTRLHGINRWCFASLRAGKGPRIHVAVEWLTLLVLHYNVSARWLLTGEGNMRRKFCDKAINS